MWGKRPYTDENTARDNFLLAIATWGEGYHNYHHIFQYGLSVHLWCAGGVDAWDLIRSSLVMG
jgi:fatty-acid desaturase